MADPGRLHQADLSAPGVPHTIQDNAAAAVSRAGEQLARTQAAMRDAVSSLKDAFGLVRGTGITPGQARSLVTMNARLGPVGNVYLAEEESQFSPAGKVPPAGVSDVAAQALAAAGMQLAQAEIAFDDALDRLVDAVDFAVHTGLPAAEVDSLLPAEPDQDGSLSTAAWAAYAAERRTAIAVPAAFRDLDLRARAAKCGGDYETARAIWTAARDLLPVSHDLRGELDGMITSLRTAARTGQYVSPDGHLLPASEAAVTAGPAEAAQQPPQPGPPPSPAGETAIAATVGSTVDFPPEMKPGSPASCAPASSAPGRAGRPAGPVSGPAMARSRRSR